MTERTVKVKLTAQAQQYIADMQKAAQATRATGSEVEKLAQKASAFELMGRTSMAAGGALAAGLTLSAKAAIDWNSAWAGVTKTVDGTPEQLAEVEAGLRGLTSELPASHDEIAAVAEAAGQLGVQAENVVAFTKTMIDLGETTNLTSQDAATQLARFTNIMGTSQEKTSNLGSAIVDLGNNYATTEAEILAMSMRLAGAGKQVGMSEGEVLGLSTALSSVGVEAEAGGSAMSKVMIDIASSVDKGGERVEKFAQISNMSADQFSEKWRTKPGEALAAFVQGLADAEKQGGTTLGMLEELGITEVRMRDALLRSASASDQFTAAMEQGNEAFDLNIALSAEAEKRYDTTAAKLEIMRNRVVDAAISLGDHFLPVIDAAADGIGGFADMLSGLDGPMGAFVAWGGAIIATGLLGAGIWMAAIPKIAEYRVALEILDTTMSGLALGGGKKLLSFLRHPLVIAIGAAITLISHLHTKMTEFDVSIDDLSATLDGETRAITQNTREWVANELQRQGVIAAGRRLGINADDLTSAWLGNSKAIAAVNAQMDTFLSKGENSSVFFYDGWMDDMGAVGNAINTGQDSIVEATGAAMDSVALAAYGVGGALAGATGETKANVEALESLQGAAETTQDAVKALADEISNFGSERFDVRKAERAFEESYDKLQASLGKHGMDFDSDTDTGRANAQTLDDYAERVNVAAASLYQLTGDQEQANAMLTEGRERLIDMLAPFMESREAAAEYVDQLGLISPEIETEIVLDKAEADARIAEINMTKIPDKLIKVGADVADAYVGIEGINVVQVDEKTAYVWAETEKAQAALDEISAKDLDKKAVEIEAETSEFDAAWNSINGRVGEAKVNITAHGLVAGEVFNLLRENADGGMYTYANGGLSEYADGGFPTGIYSGGAPIHKFAEPETLWEAYISGKPSERDRNRMIWAESGERLGVMDELRGLISAMSVGGGITVQQTINSAPGMSAETVARLARGEVSWALEGV